MVLVVVPVLVVLVADTVDDVKLVVVVVEVMILVSQLVPVYPNAQLHVYVFTPSEHVP